VSTPTLIGLISRGYFPKELPPAFNTRSLAKIAKNPAALPPEFTNPKTRTKNINHSYLARANSRRRLGIVNPINYVALSINIVNHWKQLESLLNRSNASLTSPVYRGPHYKPHHGPPGRAFGYKYSYDRMDDLKASVRSRSRYILRTDINQFYHSIYTHSIAWAVHGKNTAKAQQHNNSLLGNVLDKLIRQSQDNQTIGIPIGPDNSFLIAEIILSACDKRLHKLGITNYTRFIDDYEFGCKSLRTAESYRDRLQELLGEFELVLNPDKTEIIELPSPLEKPCISTIRTFDLRDSRADSQRYALIHIFDIVFGNTRENPDVSILKYLLGRLIHVKIEKPNWNLYESLLLQCVMSDTSTISYVLDEFRTYKSMGYPLKMSHIKEAMTFLIKAHAPINHGSEVAWALWVQIVLGLPVSETAANAACKMNDSVVAILLLDANAKHLIQSPVNFNDYQSLMTKSGLYGDQWLLSYEANVKNWLPSRGTTDYVGSDKCFGFLKSASVAFYDDKWPIKNKPKVKPTTPIGGGGGGGGVVY